MLAALALGDRALFPAFLSLVALAVVFAPLAWAGLKRLERCGWREFALYAGLSVALAAFQARYLLEAQPIQFSDFMICRWLAMQIAEAVRAGAWGSPFQALAKSMADEYSLLSALVPGFALGFAPQSRAGFQAALTLAYAAPAMLALGAWARRIALATGAAIPRHRTLDLAVATGLACLVAPGAITAVAFGMPDLGGVALVVLALALSDRLLAALEFPSQRAEKAAIKAAVRLAATLFAMFLFRRWYLFAAAGIGAALALELAFRARRIKNLRAVAVSAAAGAAALAVFSAPVALAWLGDWRSHDYAAIYAGYNYDVAELLRRFGAWYGLAPAAAAIFAAGVLAFVDPGNRPLRLTIVSCLVAGALQLRVQSPSLQHFYLVLPLLTAPIGALALLVLRKDWRRVAFVGAAFAAATLSPLGPLVGAGALLPTASLPPAPRADLSDLLRLRGWIETHASADRRYCVLGSSEIISGVLVDELWQLEPSLAPVFDDARRKAILLPQVDARDGPIGREFERCAFLVVANPEQTSLQRDFMWVAALPARELLTGQGIGEKFRRTGDIFHLIGGVDAIVYSRTDPVTDEDVDMLAVRWRAAPRSETAHRAAARFL